MGSNSHTLNAATKKTFSRSSGPGGQNVNKTSSKVLLEFSISDSSLVPIQKTKLFERFPSGAIQVSNQTTRSQLQNTRLAFERLEQIIKKTLEPKKSRKKTPAPYATRAGKERKRRMAKLLQYKMRNINLK